MLVSSWQSSRCNVMGLVLKILALICCLACPTICNRALVFLGCRSCPKVLSLPAAMDNISKMLLSIF
eukprot:5730061-Pyramimonas_sp.AAC.1